MADNLRKLNQDYKNKKQVEKDKRFGENREWIVSTYQKNPITIEDLEKLAKKGYNQCNIFTTDSFGTEYYKIGTASSFPNNPLESKPYIYSDERRELTSDACETVKRLFEKANKDNGWKLKVNANCHKIYATRDVTVSW